MTTLSLGAIGRYWWWEVRWIREVCSLNGSWVGEGVFCFNVIFLLWSKTVRIYP